MSQEYLSVQGNKMLREIFDVQFPETNEVLTLFLRESLRQELC